MNIAKRVAVMGGVLAGAVAGGGAAVDAGAQNPVLLEVDIEVLAPDAANVLDGIDVEVYEAGEPPTQIDPGCAEGSTDVGGPHLVHRRDDCVGLESQQDYVLGLAGVPAGMPVRVYCESEPEPPALVGVDTQSVLVPDPPDVNPEFNTDWGPAYCAVYIGGNLDVDASVVNDSGGTATATDISVEVFDNADPSTPLIAATPCAADGNCLNVILPDGEYTIGYIGPDGYTREIAQTVTDATFGEAARLDTQAIVTDDPDAVFEIIEFRLVEIDITAQDPVPATTTTTTTTTTTPTTTTTTLPATTTTTATTTTPTTTTTIAVPLAPTLPATGASDAANTRMAVIAVALIAVGGALVIAVGRRRTV